MDNSLNPQEDQPLKHANQAGVESESSNVATGDESEWTASQALLEHAMRCWEAEAENADRIEKQSNLISGVVFLLLGLGLYRVEWFYDASQAERVHWLWASCTIKTMIAFALVFLGFGLAKLQLGARSRSSTARTASDHLRLRTSDLENDATTATFFRTHTLRTYAAGVSHAVRVMDWRRGSSSWSHAVRTAANRSS